MVAVLQFVESNGAGELETVLTNGNFGSTDAPNLVAANFTVTRPNSGSNYSYEKWWRVHWVSGAATLIDNMKFWKTAGAYVTGETIEINLQENVRVNDAYPAGGPVNTESAVAVYTLDEAEPPDPNVFTAYGAGNNELTEIGQYTDYIVLQTAIAAGATLGPANSKTFRLEYDEQ